MGMSQNEAPFFGLKRFTLRMKRARHFETSTDGGGFHRLGYPKWMLYNYTGHFMNIDDLGVPKV